MTDIEKVRLLVGSPAGEFTDDQVQGFLDLAAAQGFGVYWAASLAYDSRAAGISTEAQEVSLGDFSTNDRTRLSTMQAAAQAYREIEYNTPAFGVIEEDLDEFSQIDLIRNFVLRNQGAI